MKAIRLKTEYLENPIGIDIEKPLLSWHCDEGVHQHSFQILCTGQNGETVWDSGRVSSSSMRASYQGRPLKSRDRIIWKVRLWDENDTAGEWSENAVFEMGLLKEHDWKASWISGNYNVRKANRYPVDCFQKQFEVREGLVCARLYITACGLYEARMNGEKAGVFCLAPGITDYRKRVQYQTIAAEELLHTGTNSLTVQLADGWYRGSVGAWGIRNAYGSETKLLAQLELTYSDGQRQTIITDDSWGWSNDGPIRFADNKDGEIIEAFRKPGYDKKAKLTGHPITPTASNNVPVTEHERFKPAVSIGKNKRLLLDFGQNIAGYLSFNIFAKQGDHLVFRFGEMLDEEGNLTQKNIQLSTKKKTTPLQKIEYSCKDGLNQYKTTFAVFGFRYAEVETDLTLSSEDVEAIAVYSDMKHTGVFHCSNEYLNQLVSCTIWSAKSNSLDIPTDCPTRERHGWTGDAQIFFGTASYLFDYLSFAKKYLKDIYDWQKKNGCLPQIAPYGGVDFYMNTMNGSVGWSDAGIIIPYQLWEKYGDRQVLADYYDRMKNYAGFMIRRCGKNGFMAKPLGLKGEAKRYAVNAGQSYGEWAEPADVYPNNWKDMVAPHPEVSTAYTAYVMRLMTKIAEELGKVEDAAYFSKYAEGCKKAYQELSRKPGFSLDTNRQARLVRPLYFQLLDAEQTEYAEQRLIKALEQYDYRIGTGFLSTPLILSVLETIDIEAAYRLLENEKMPGWLYMPKNGATTIWESWEGTNAQDGIGSLNHYSKGAVCEWLFRSMCGIRLSGENHFTITPMPGGNIDSAKARYVSIYGEVESSWKKEEEKILYNIEIPANCTAEICLPGVPPFTVCAGRYQYSV